MYHLQIILLIIWWLLAEVVVAVIEVEVVVLAGLEQHLAML
jgi:hypothetical protein